MTTLKIAVQKSGRLCDDSLALLKRSGLNFDSPRGRLVVPCDGFSAELMMIRDDDIPGFVVNGACDAGIVGLNVLEEFLLKAPSRGSLKILRQLGFGKCRLSLAIPEGKAWSGVADLEGQVIATSYPTILKAYLALKGVNAAVTPMAGSLEIAPRLGIAYAICDLVASGATLRANGLREVERLLDSEAVFVTAANLSPAKDAIAQRLAQRCDGVLQAQSARYVMMNARRSDVAAIRALAPGLTEPTVVPLAGDEDRVAVHVVAAEDVFWETLESLKRCGATDLLVLPIEKLMR